MVDISENYLKREKISKQRKKKFVKNNFYDSNLNFVFELKSYFVNNM